MLTLIKVKLKLIIAYANFMHTIQPCAGLFNSDILKDKLYNARPLICQTFCCLKFINAIKFHEISE